MFLLCSACQKYQDKTDAQSGHTALCSELKALFTVCLFDLICYFYYHPCIWTLFRPWGNRWGTEENSGTEQRAWSWEAPIQKGLGMSSIGFTSERLEIHLKWRSNVCSKHTITLKKTQSNTNSNRNEGQVMMSLYMPCAVDYQETKEHFLSLEIWLLISGTHWFQGTKQNRTHPPQLPSLGSSQQRSCELQNVTVQEACFRLK